jgi:hypothetical protein
MNDMNERRGTYLVLALGLGMLGCETENISVGSEGSALNLARCWGTDCENRVSAETVEPASVGQCDSPPERALELAWERELCGMPCSATRLVTAPDGSAWVLALNGGSGLVLSHHALDGSLLGEVAVGTNSNPLVETDLSCDQRGHCYVSWYILDAGENADSELSQSAFVQEFDALARPVAAAIPLHGVAKPLVRAGGPGKIALAGPAWNGAHRGSVAVLDAGASKRSRTTERAAVCTAMIIRVLIGTSPRCSPPGNTTTLTS